VILIIAGLKLLDEMIKASAAVPLKANPPKG
jgi:hypothetical protein